MINKNLKKNIMSHFILENGEIEYKACDTCKEREYKCPVCPYMKLDEKIFELHSYFEFHSFKEAVDFLLENATENTIRKVFAGLLEPYEN